MKKLILLYLTIIISFVFTSCQKGDDSGGGASTFPYYFIANVNGATVRFEADDLSSRYSNGISQPSSSIGFTDYDIYEGTVFVDNQDLSKGINVHILKYFDHDPSQAERTAMIQIGNYGYGFSDVSSSTVNGASIYYVDANGDNWFSETGSQAGSTFTITELVNSTTGFSGKIFKANFSCKLYDINGTSSIQVSNATIKGKILSP